MARTLVPVFVIASAALLLTGCGVEASASGQPPIKEASVEPGGNGQSGDRPADVTAGPSKPGPSPSKPYPSKTTTSKKPQGPTIVYFRVKQKPKCPEGTAVFRAEAVPLIIEWKISGATSGALSVDDNTHTPGTYGPVELKGTQEFRFSCGGAVGTTEKHTYALYTVGGGTQKSKTITAKAKVLDKGLGTTDGNG